MPIEQEMSSSRSHKRAAVSPPEDALASLPSNDSNSWYYPAHFENTSEEEDVLSVRATQGNWGRKQYKSSRWMRKGKNAPWGPGKYEWELEERVRKRLKAALPQPPRSPSPPVLPHLRSPSPPLTAPYPQLTFEHSNYSSLIMDPSVQNSFRSQMLGDIGRAINNLIEGEAAMKRAVGRLWQAVYANASRIEDGLPDPKSSGDVSRPKSSHLPYANGDVFSADGKAKLEPEHSGAASMVLDDDEGTYVDHNDSRDAMQDEDLSSDEVPKPQKVPAFLTPGLMALINDLVGDSSEYVSRLEEVREGLGFTFGQRNALWTTIREKALAEMQQQEEDEEDLL